MNMNNNATGYLAEQAVAYFIDATGLSLLKDLNKQPVDFIIDDHRVGGKVAVEVKRSPPGKKMMPLIAERIIAGLAVDIDRFIFVTPDKPNEEQKQFFSNIFEEAPFSADWVSIQDLPMALGISGELDITNPNMIKELLLAAMTSKLTSYTRTDGSIGLQPAGLEVKSIIEAADHIKEDIPESYRLLARQFSFSNIARLAKNDLSITNGLHIGESHRNTVVIQSDLKDFSKLAESANPEDLSELMTSYYRDARDQLWGLNGTLDKFIGDSVVAVFNYPFEDNRAEIHAIQFAEKLIDLGRILVTELHDRIDEEIPSGTRIGIACGNISILNIGQDQIEVAFVGDTLSLVTRLQEESEVNGILLSNIFKARVLKKDPEYLDKYKIYRRGFDPDQVKGRRYGINAWQIPPLIASK